MSMPNGYNQHPWNNQDPVVDVPRVHLPPYGGSYPASRERPQRPAGHPFGRTDGPQHPKRRPPSVSFQQPPQARFDDEGAFPSLRPPTPAVKLPQQRPSSDHIILGYGQTSQLSDLSERMRTMILQNQGGSPQQPTAIDYQALQNRPLTSRSVDKATPQAKTLRENQRTRKQKQLEGQQLLTSASHKPSGPAQTRFRPQGYPLHQYQEPRCQLNPTSLFSNRPPPLGGTQWHPTPQVAQTQPFRPPPQHRQLFDPNSGQDGYNAQGQIAHQTESLRQPLANVQDQLHYVRLIAEKEVSEAELGSEEFELKDRLRVNLEALCRAVVTDHERQTNPEFLAESVRLDRFGSLATTFATKNSDMDLVLTSPHSTVDASSTDSPLPRLIEKVLLKSKYGARLLTRTRVPIIKFCEKPTPELFEGLVNARLDWEQERDAPRPHNKARDNTFRTDKGNVDPTLQPHQLQSSEANIPNGSDGAEERTEPDQQSRESVDRTSSTEEAAHQQTPTKGAPGEQTDGIVPAVQPLQGAEKNGDSLLSMSDEQLIRLLRVAYQTEQYSLSERRIIVDYINAYELYTSTVSDTFTPSAVYLNSVRDKIYKLDYPRADTKRLRPTQDLESDDPMIASKSDEERVRLYRLAMKEDWYSMEERRTIIDFITAYETFVATAACPSPAISEALDTARSNLALLPNVLRRYRPSPQKHLDYPKSGVGIQCDINFSNCLGLHNSTLLRCYSLCDARVRPMVIFIKSWAKKRRINSAYESTLSSYGYVLMVLHYLVNVVSPRVLPNLQLYCLSSQPNTPNGPAMVDGHLVHFFRDEATLSHMASRGQLTINREPLPSLLRCFFAYYGSDNYPNFKWMRDCLSLRTPGGIISKQDKGWTAAKTELQPLGNWTPDKGKDQAQTKEIRQRYLLAIEDPFETEHNVGRTVSHDGICAIRDEFRRAWRLISHAGGDPAARKEELFEEATERGNLQYRYFGPNPRRGGGKAVERQGKNGKGEQGDAMKGAQGSVEADNVAGKGKEGPATTGPQIESTKGQQSSGKDEKSSVTTSESALNRAMIASSKDPTAVEDVLARTLM